MSQISKALPKRLPDELARRPVGSRLVYVITPRTWEGVPLVCADERTCEYYVGERWGNAVAFKYIPKDLRSRGRWADEGVRIAVLGADQTKLAEVAIVPIKD